MSRSRRTGLEAIDRRRDLRGRSFRSQNLSGADFTGADIRGADFGNADLSDANFQAAKAGVRPVWAIAFVAIALTIALASSYSAALASFWIGYQLTITQERLPCSIAFFLLTLIIFALITRWRGLLLAIGSVPAIVAAVIPITGMIFVAGSGQPTAASAGTGSAAIAIAGALAGSIAIAIAGISAGKRAIGLTTIGIIVGAAFGVVRGRSEISPIQPWNISRGLIQLLVATTIASLTTMAIVLLSALFAKRALAEDSRYALIRELAVWIAASKGTCFRRANLAGANFQQAQLSNTNFQQANTAHTCWRSTSGIDRSRLGGTILSQTAVRDLLICGSGAGRSFAALNLQGANLNGANLRRADFTRADLSGSTLIAACLEGANLSRSLALGANFDRARLTGACLEAWAIDETTNLAAACDYIYLKANQQERIPASGKFASGAFTKLFQKVLDTIDFIFQGNFDDSAFQLAWNRLKVEHEAAELVIQGIETKADGFVVVRVKTSPNADKSKIHTDFTRLYDDVFEVLEARYRSRLESKDQQIIAFLQSQAELTTAIQQLPAQLLDRLVEQSLPAIQAKSFPGKTVILKIGQSSEQSHFFVLLQIIDAATQAIIVQSSGELPYSPVIFTAYDRWQFAYRRNLQQTACRLDIPTAQMTNISYQELFQECQEFAIELHQSLNRWFNAEHFRSIKEELLAALSASEPVYFTIQTENLQLQRLPFKLWNLFDRYPQAEISLSSIAYKQPQIFSNPTSKVKILAILGDSTGIDIRGDQTLLEQLPNAEVTFLVEPKRQELSDWLWAQPWSILFFAGHSTSQTEQAGQICINQVDRLSINDLKHGLRKAIEQGLTLAIFNSCDGLHLASDLAVLQIPYLIVMREPVPDRVAQEFLKYFLMAFSQGEPFHQAVHTAREQLQGLEDVFPYATWLPVIWQFAQTPLVWQHLYREPLT